MTLFPQTFWQRLLNIRRDEWTPVLLSALFFFCVLTALMVLRPAREALGMQRALMRPARETLFTVVSREDKYKAKAFIDTFVYRGGDVVGAQLEGALMRLAMGLAALTSVAVPLALLWAGLGVWLGRAQQRAVDDSPVAHQG